MKLVKSCLAATVAAVALCAIADVSKFDSRIAADTAMASAGALGGKLHYLSCCGMLPADGEATHDYIHPNDYGSVQMGRVFAKRIAELLK